MAETGTCTDCGATISTDVDECPECGFAPDSGEIRKLGAVTLIVSLIVGVLVSQLLAAILAVVALIVLGLSFVDAGPTG